MSCLLRVAVCILTLALWTGGTSSLQAASLPGQELLHASRQLAEAGRLDDAIASANDALRRLPDVAGAYAVAVEPWVYYDLARWEAERGRSDEARRLGAESIRRAELAYGVDSPALASLLTQQARLHRNAGACKQALADLDRVAENFSAWKAGGDIRADLLADALLELFWLRREMGLQEAAASTLKEAGTLAPLPDAALLRFESARFIFALDQHDAERAAEVAGRARASFGDESFARPTLVWMSALVSRQRGDLTAATQLLDEFLSSATDEVPAPDWARAWRELGVVEGLRGRFVVAESHFQQALRLYDHLPAESIQRSDIHANLGWVYRWLGDLEQARFHYDTALRGSTACTGGNDRRTVSTLLERTRLYLETGAVTAAMNDARRAEQIVLALETPPPLAQAYVNHALAQVHVRLGQFAEAERLARGTIARILEVRGPDGEDLVPVYTLLAEVALLQREPAAARDWALEAVRIRERSGAASFWGLGTALSLLVASQAEIGADPRLQESLERFLDVSTEYLALAATRGSRILPEVGRHRRTLERVADALATSPIETSETAWARLVQIPHLSEASALAASAATMVGADPGSRDLVRQRVEVGERLQARQSQLSNLLEQREAVDEALVRRLLTELDDDRVIVRDLNARLQASSATGARFLIPRIVDLQTLADLLQPWEALLVQMLTDSHTHTLIVLGGGAVHHRSAPIGKAVVRRHVSRLRRSLDLALPLAERLAFDDRAAHELYLAAIAPAADLLVGVSEIVVVADDAYQSIPWSVFRAGPPPRAGSDTRDRGEFLIDRFAVSMVPSPDIFETLRRHQQRRPAPKPFIGFGNPLLSGRAGAAPRQPDSLVRDFLRGPGASDVLELEPLPHTADELQAMAKLLGAGPDDVRTGAGATRRAVREADLQQYRIVSFATHGLVSGEFRGLAEPALVLTPDERDGLEDNGLLVSSEISALQLSAELVILSACNTGRSDSEAGASGLPGLVRSFLTAGAESLLVSHWAVSSEATVPLMTTVIRSMQDDASTSRAEALRRAMIWMKDGGAGGSFTNPAYWAPFMLVGNSALRADRG